MKVSRMALTLVFALVMAMSAGAQSLTIDDFTSGLYQSPRYTTGTSNASKQPGSMMGGTRLTNMNVCPLAQCATYNPYNQGSSYGFYGKTSVRDHAMVQTGGYDVGPRIDMAYGGGAAMDEKFSVYEKIRLTFQGLSQPLNFNIQLFTGGAWAQGGCNINELNRVFTVDLPLSKFVKTKGFDLSHVTYANFIFQNGSVIGGVDFAISKIELTNDAPSTVDVVDCHY